MSIAITRQAPDSAQITVRQTVVLEGGSKLCLEQRQGLWFVDTTYTTESWFYEAAVNAVGERISDQAALYAHMPATGGALLSASLTSDAPRTVTVLRDDLPLQSFVIDGSADIQVWIEMEAGDHTIRLAIDPACPAQTIPGVSCAGMIVNSITLEQPE